MSHPRDISNVNREMYMKSGHHHLLLSSFWCPQEEPVYAPLFAELWCQRPEPNGYNFATALTWKVGGVAEEGNGSGKRF